MAQQIVIPGGRPLGRKDRARSWLRGRRLTLVAGLALVEVLAAIVFRPGLLAATLLPSLILVLAVMLALRMKPGIARDLVWVVALAQATVVLVPLLLGASIVAALLVTLTVLIAMVLIGLRFRI